jgi:predicted transcriptional regulator
MSAVSLRLPDSLKDRVQRLARLDGVSMNQYITLAVAEKAALDEAGKDQLRYLEARAAPAGEDYADENLPGENPREVIQELLGKAPDVEPPPEDRLPG